MKWLRKHWFDDAFWGLRMTGYGVIIGFILRGWLS